ncbi:MATE family efflux transporter [Lentisphaera profundi]|uniref:MATE family efflux transporter n=1 Tax=Lentisphaera profundi TaxID=1658616 RepID=A0ABY7W273_9BACT|nr:MATE family efflux transporter [Lentisphaera profundi]WDE98383.1 MATE family efflux transporter [Lentisphaera profundi]
MKNNTLLTDGPIAKAIASIAIPMLIMMLTAVCFSWLDAWYIAKLGETELTAIDIAFPLITFSSSIIYGGLGTGVSAAIAAYSSAKKDLHTAAGLRYGMIIALITSALISLAIIFFGEALLQRQLSGKPEVILLANQYCFWYYLFFPLMGIGAVLASAMRGTGNAVRPMIYSLIAMFVNAVLTPLLSYESSGHWYSELFLDMGIKGAALSTVASYSLMTLLLAFDFIHERQGLKKNTQTLPVTEQQKVLKRILYTSSIAALVPACTNFTIGISQALLASRGPEILDAYSLSKRFEQFLIMLAIPLCAANMIIISANLGKKNYSRIKQSFIFSSKIMLGLSSLAALFMFFQSSAWFSSFSQNELIHSEGHKYFQFAALHIILLPLCIMLNFAFQGLSQAAKPLPYTLGSVFLFQALGCYLLISNNKSTESFYLSLSLGTSLAFIFCLRKFFHSLQYLETKKAETLTSLDQN